MFSIIEGFYGKAWSQQQRLFLIDLLSLANSNAMYCYAPKSEEKLRGKWSEEFDPDTFLKLRDLSERCRSQGVGFCLGFSPLNIHTEWNDQNRPLVEQQLKLRCEEFNRLDVSALGVFFDDMRGDLPDLAQTQLQLLDCILNYSDVQQIYFCPSYYSFDPVLECLFGAMPTNYWQELAEGIASLEQKHHLAIGSIKVLWTGDKVITEQYSQSSLDRADNIFLRPITLWDNRGVNDGRLTSPYLPIKSLMLPEGLKPEARSVWLNPSNAFSIAVMQFIGAELRLTTQELLTLLPKSFCDFFQHYDEPLNSLGIDELLFESCEKMRADVSKLASQLSDSQNSKNINSLEQCFSNEQWQQFLIEDLLAWLRGDFRFDPECLT